eukprot:tig00021312_g20042.t1
MQRPRKSSEGSACTRSPRRWHRRRAAHTGRLLVLLLAFWDLESVSSAVGHARSPGSADALACEALCGEPRVPAGKASAADLEWLAQKRRLGPGGGADGADGADGAESSSLVRVLKEKERRDHMDLLLVQRMFLEQLPFPGGHSLPSDFADFADAGGAAALEERFMRISPLTPSNLEQGDLFLLSEAVKAGDCWMFASAGFGLHLCWMFAIPDTGGPLNFDVDFYNASSRAAIDRFGTLKRLPSRLVHREIPKDDDLFLWGAAYGLDTEIQLIHVNKSGHVAAALPLFAPDSTERHEKRRLSDFGIGRLYLLRYFHPQTGDVVYEALSPLPGSLCLCSPPLSRNFAYDRDEGPTYTQQEQTPSGASSSAAGCKKSAKPPPQAAKPPSSSSKEEPRPAAAAAAASTSSPRPCPTPAPRPRPKSSPPIASSSAAPHPASAEDAGTDAIADAIKFPDCAALCGEPHIPASKASTADLEWLAQKRRLGPSGGGGGGRAEGIVSSLSEQQRSFHARQSSTKREHLGPEPLLLFSDFADEEGAPALRERFVRLDPAGLDLDWGVSDWWKTVDALAVADSWAFAEAGYHLNRTRLDDDDFYSTALRLKIELAPAFDRYPKSDLAASSGEDLRAVDLSPRALEESRFQAAATALDTEIQLILVDESGRVTALPPFAPNSTDREKRRRQLSDFGIGRLYVLRYYVLDPIADYLVYEALAAAVSPTSAPLDLENSGQIPATQLSATQVATSPAAAAAASDHVQELWKTTSANSELADCAALCGEPRVPAGKASAADLAWLAQKRRLAMGPAPGSKADRKLKGVVKVASADELAAHKQVVLAHAGLEFVGPAPLSEFSDFADAKGADALRSRFKRIFPGLLDVKTDSWNLFLKALKVGEKWGFMEKGYSLDLARLDDALFYSTSVKRSMNEDLSPALMHGQISARANSRFWAAATALDTEIQLIHVDESGHVAALPPFSPNGTAAPDGHADGRRLSDFGIGRLFVLSYFHPELGAGDVFYEALSPLPGSPHACPCSPPLPRDFAYPQASAPVDVSATPAPEMRPAAVQPGPPTSTTYARAASSSAGVASGSPEAAAVDRPPHPSTSTATRAERGGDLEQATNADSASASDLEVEFPVDCSKKCREIPSHANRLLWAAAYALDVEVQLILVDESGRVTALPPFAPNSTGTNTGAYPQREVTKIPERSLSDFGIGRLYVLRYVHPRTKRAMYEALAPLPAAGRLCACSPPLPRDFAYRQLPQLQTAPEKSKVASSKPASSSSSSTRAVQAPAAVQERAGQAPAAVQERAVQAPAAVQEPGASSAPVHGWPRAPRDVVTASAVLFACLASVPLFLQRRRRRLAPASAASAVEAHAAVAAATAAKALEASAVELGRELAAARSGEAAARAEAAEAQAEAREARRARRRRGSGRLGRSGGRSRRRRGRGRRRQAAARAGAARGARGGGGGREAGDCGGEAGGEAEEALAAQRAAAERRLRGALGPVLEELEAGLVSLERAALPGLLRRLWPAIVAGARQRECAVCLGAVPEEHLRVLLPCLHASACGACVGRLPARQCPQCREPFERAARVFLADHAPAPGPA